MNEFLKFLRPDKPYHDNIDPDECEQCEIIGDSVADCGLKCDVHGELFIKHVCVSHTVLEAIRLSTRTRDSSDEDHERAEIMQGLYEQLISKCDCGSHFAPKNHVTTCPVFIADHWSRGAFIKMITTQNHADERSPNSAIYDKQDD